jgi:hypothetical protein
MTFLEKTNSTRMPDRRSYPDLDLKLLFGNPAGRCAFPCCRKPCLEPATTLDRATVTGIVAHIAAHSDGGPRANHSLAQKQRDRYENWILLCSEHHTIVDRQPNTYTSDDLLRWKAEHEQWVVKRLQEAMPQVTFAELRVTAFALLQDPDKPSEAYILTPPLTKMDKNGLAQPSRNLLKFGLAKAKDVEHFIQFMAIADPYFPERLKSGFVAEYNNLLDEGLRGDALFQSLLAFATGSSTDFAVQCAALSVLSYMFEKCEVFEG